MSFFALDTLELGSFLGHFVPSSTPVQQIRVHFMPIFHHKSCNHSDPHFHKCSDEGKHWTDGSGLCLQHRSPFKGPYHSFKVLSRLHLREISVHVRGRVYLWSCRQHGACSFEQNVYYQSHNFNKCMPPTFVGNLCVRIRKCHLTFFQQFWNPQFQNTARLKREYAI